METLKDKYRDYFKVGVAVNGNTIRSHRDIIIRHFNSITCENEMKYASVTPAEDIYDFTAADRIAGFAAEHQLTMRGHTFVWHNQTPDWIFENTDRKTLLERLRNHISLLGERYKNRVSCWDVINEAVEDKNDLLLRQTKWLQVLGEGYMDDIFLAAKELLPDRKLFYNDYNETNPEKRSKIIRIIKGMKERGVPVDGIGLQCHWNLIGPSVEEVRKSLELYAALDVRIHITELDISLFEFGDTGVIEKPTEKMYQKQSEAYGSYFKVFREYKDVIDSVTFWGIADDCTWLDDFPVRGRKNWPLLFDEEHNPKEAFYRLMDF